MAKPSNDPSIEHEPHLRPDPNPPPSPVAGKPVLPYANPGMEAPAPDSVFDEPHLNSPTPINEDEQVEHGVWDEPALAPEIAGSAPADAATYAKWLVHHRERFGALRSWGLVFATALAAGPWAIAGAFYAGGQTAFGVLAIIVFAPVVEELMKVALPMILVEKRPYVFRSGAQIVLCGLAGGAAFGAIENLMYLHVYIPDPSPGLVMWRWTVCTALHTTCSGIAAVGLARVWHHSMKDLSRPKIALAAPFLTTAMILHGAYNAFAVALDIGGVRF